MEEEARPRRSVAELAGRFKGSAGPHNTPATEMDKPVRRRPPRSLHIPKTQGDEQEPPDVTSPQPKAKRNSALIEKLQANLALSPTAMLPSPKSPGFKLVSPTFTPLSPSSSTSSTATPTTPLTTSPVTEEQRAVSFEDPLAVAEGSILSSVNKGRVRHSLRRRPPSRRHRKSSSGDDVGVNDVADSNVTSPSEPQDKTTTGAGEEGQKEGGGEKEQKEGEGEEQKEGGGEEQKEGEGEEQKEDGGEQQKEGGGEIFVKEGKTDKDDKTDASKCPEKIENESESESREGDKKEEEERPDGSTGGEAEGSSSGRKEGEEEKKNSGEEQSEVSTEGATDTETKEEESKETKTQSSDR